MPLVWSLSYPSFTEDEQTRVRHHAEMFRQDPNVAGIEIEQDPNTPTTRFRVEFRDDNGPTSVELKNANKIFPAGISEATLAAAVRLQQHIRITGMSMQEVANRMQQVSVALRTPMFPELYFRGEDVARAEIPPWVVIGRPYRYKMARIIITLMGIQYTNGQVLMDIAEDGGPRSTVSLLEFIERFNPYDRGSEKLTAWDVLLADDWL